MMKKSIDSPFRKLKMLMVLPLIAMVFYAFAKPEYISLPATSTGTSTITTIADALNELKAPTAAPVDKSEKVVPVEKSKIVKGKVVNSEGKPIQGTSIILVGSTNGTITDMEGHFELKDVPNDGELAFSFVGYQTVRVKPDFKKPMTINMVTAVVGLDKVVVVGYANPNGPPPPPPPQVSAFDSKNPPLYILDGETIDKAKMDKIMAEGVESVEVLKDKSATDKYGDKGKNGVILITSKGKASASADQKVDKATKSETKYQEVFIVVESLPEFPGGKEALMKFIQMNIKYPAEAQKANAQGKVFVSFVVSSAGKVENAKVVRSVYPALDAEALRLVNSMPDWEPGRQRGVAVDVAYTLPIEFMLQ